MPPTTMTSSHKCEPKQSFPSPACFCLAFCHSSENSKSCSMHISPEDLQDCPGKHGLCWLTSLGWTYVFRLSGFCERFALAQDLRKFLQVSTPCFQLFRGSFSAVSLRISRALVMELGSLVFPNTQNSSHRLLLPTLKKGLPSSVTLLWKLTGPKLSPLVP